VARKFADFDSRDSGQKSAQSDAENIPVAAAESTHFCYARHL
jgi:hypothetical protein